MMGWSYDSGATGWVVMTLFMIAFWAFVVFGIVLVLRGTRNSDDTGTRLSGREAPGPDALQVLEQRFASGEIDENEYQSRKSVLGQR